MVKIRLMRMGSKRNPHYRMVVVDSRRRRNGAYIESLGFYDPRDTKETPIKIDTERAAHWLSVGAQPTDRVLKLLEQQGVEVGKVLVKRRRSFTARQGEAATS